MVYYLIFILLIIFLSLFRLKLSTILCIIILTYSFYNHFNFDQISFIFWNNLQLLSKKQEIMAIIFFLFSSELFHQLGYFENLKNFLTNKFNSNFWNIIIFLNLSAITISSAVIFSQILPKVYKQSEIKGGVKNYLKFQYLLTSISLLLPVSIPIFIISSLLSLSTKKIILLSFIFGNLIFILYYFIFIKKNIQQEKNIFFSIYRVLPIIIYSIIFYFLIFSLSYNILITSEILFVFTFIVTFIQNKKIFKEYFFKIFNNAINRTGVILSIIYLIYIINFFHTYTNSIDNTFNFIISNFSDSTYIVLLIYIVAFFLNFLLDPLGVIMILSPIYISILKIYSINEYAFVLSFIIFITLGLSSNIVGLPGHSYRNKFNINTNLINELLLKEHLLIVIISFLPFIILKIF